jgi:hypothetical protein
LARRAKIAPRSRAISVTVRRSAVPVLMACVDGFDRAHDILFCLSCHFWERLNSSAAGSRMALSCVHAAEPMSGSRYESIHRIAQTVDLDCGRTSYEEGRASGEK